MLHRRFEPEPVLEAIQKERVALFFAVPTVFIYLLNMDTSHYDLSSLRYCFTAAANMPRETALGWEEKFGMIIHEGYGLTECSPFASYNHDFSHKFGSIGMPIENVDMKIADEAGKELPAGEMDFCRTNMAVYRVPRKVIVVNELPKSATGKILKRILRVDE